MSHGVYAAHRIELSMKTFPMKRLQMFTRIRIKIRTVPESTWNLSVVRIVLIQASDSLVHCVRCPLPGTSVAIYIRIRVINEVVL